MGADDSLPPHILIEVVMKKYLIYLVVLVALMLLTVIVIVACATSEKQSTKNAMTFESVASENVDIQYLEEHFPVGDYLLAINEHRISHEEFDFFLKMERTTTASYFGSKYNAVIDADFWERNYEGITPIDHAKDAALRNMIALYAQLDLGVQWGLLWPEEGNFGGFVAELETVNEDRAKMLEEGEAFQGLTEFDLPTFFHYRRAQLSSDLHFHQIGLNTSTEEELRELFAETMHMYGGGMDIVIKLIHENGSEEIMDIIRDNIHREHLELATLYEVMLGAQIGERVDGLAWEGKTVSAVLLEQIPLGFMSFADVRPSVMANHANILVIDEINRRADNSVIRLNENKWSNVEMRH